MRCDDVDECATQYGVCSQFCKNHAGSFECSCADGYFMSGQTCKASGNTDAILFFSGKSEIRGLNLRTKSDFVVTTDKRWTKTAIGIAYDARDNRVYWTATENSRSRIISSLRDGTGRLYFWTLFFGVAFGSPLHSSTMSQTILDIHPAPRRFSQCQSWYLLHTTYFLLFGSFSQ